MSVVENEPPTYAASEVFMASNELLETIHFRYHNKNSKLQPQNTNFAVPFCNMSV